MVKRWEYKIIDSGDKIEEEEFNQLGDEGWELIVYSPTAEGYARFVAVFKREK